MRLEKPIFDPLRLRNCKHCLAPSLSMPLSYRQSMVWCPWICARRQCLKLLNTSDLPRSKPLARVALPALLSARSFLFTPATPGQYSHRSFRRWMWTIGTFQSRLPIPLFTFCRKLIFLRLRLTVFSQTFFLLSFCSWRLDHILFATSPKAGPGGI